MHHNHVSKSCCPFMMSLISKLNMVTPSIFKVTLYPSLHNWQTESSELFAITGKTCANEAALLSSGVSIRSVCIESMLSQVVSLTHNGYIDLVFLRHRSLICKKIQRILIHLCQFHGGLLGVGYEIIQLFLCYF